jgi:ubiquinone biosynthesis protein UbiJ
MLQTLNTLLAPAVMERLTLAINHVLGSEDAATARLRPHAGRTVEIVLGGWPAMLPVPPSMAFRITPAGLVEWCGVEHTDEPDLGVRVDASNPALLLARGLIGERPAVDIDGDVALAGDVNWLAQNLRWDVEADLERVVGPAAAHQLHRLGSLLASGLRTAVQAANGLKDRLRPDAR